MSFQTGNTGWNNVHRTYFSSNSNGNNGNHAQKRKENKKDPDDMFNSTHDPDADLEVEVDKGILKLLWEFIVSIFRTIFRIKNKDGDKLKEEDSFELSKKVQ